MVSSHTDIPERWASIVGSAEEEGLMRDIDRRLERYGGSAKDDKKEKKRLKKEKKREKKEKERRKIRKSLDELESAPPEAEEGAGEEYFDIKSQHSLIPLLPYNNSYNRNMVLTFSHSGVRFIMDRILATQDDYRQVFRMRDKILKREEPA